MGRYYYIDLLRGILMSLGVVYHSSLVFQPSKKWYISSDTEYEWMDFITDFIHSFRMESFYIISGFFSIMLIEKYLLRRFINSRMIRLGVPMLFVGIVINSIMFLYVKELLPYKGHPVLIFGKYFWLGGTWLSHLWFLANLLVSSLFLALFCYFVDYNNLKRLMSGKINYYLFIVVVSLSVVLLRHIEWRLPDPPYGKAWIFIFQIELMRYMPYYIVGVVLFMNKRLFEDFHNNLLFNILIVITSLFFIYGNFIELFPYLDEIIKAVYGVVFTGVLFGVFRKFFNYKNKIIYLISDSSYTVYVLHQPLIIIMGYYLFRLKVNDMLIYMILILASWIIPYIVHINLVKRKQWLGILLNGKKYK